MHPASAPARDPAILIVDDAPACIDSLRQMMTLQGYQTLVANSGERALGIARRMHPDLILLDVMMPGMDGLETCRQLKLHPGTEDIPVIFMSAANETDDVVAGLDRGAVDYIGKPLRMAEVCARVRTQLQIHRQNASRLDQSRRLRTIVDTMAEGLMVLEASGRIQYSNPACDQYLGYPDGDLAGHVLADLLEPQVAQEYQRVLCGPPGRLGTREVQVRRRDGTGLSMDLTLTPMQAAGAPLFIGLLHDISHRKQYQDRLEQAALADPLTKIANRRQFDNVLEREWQRAVRATRPLSLIVLDVDHFKLYNDALGHAAGDAALRDVGAVLAAHAARASDLAARYGGEEFVLLLAETDADAARRMAESIRAAVEALRLASPHSPVGPWLTASVGLVTIVPGQGDLLDEFFVAADRAMYAAKEAGRNRVVAVAVGDRSWQAVQLLSPA